jgi:hypothetical protein
MPQFLDVRTYITAKDEKPYHITDADESGDPRYYSYCDINGSWVIMSQNASTGAHRYISGKSDYATNWTGRAGLSYDYIFNI